MQTIDINLRLILDEGNHTQAFLLAGLTLFYLLDVRLKKRPTTPSTTEEQIPYYFPLNTVLLDKKCIPTLIRHSLRPFVGRGGAGGEQFDPHHTEAEL